MSIMDFVFQTLIILAMIVVINCTFIAYLYITHEYEKVDKFFPGLGNDVNYGIDNVVRIWTVSVF